MRPFLLAIVLLTLAQFAKAKTCSPEDARAAEAITGTLATWQEIHSGYRKYSQCDDGAIGQGFTESVVRQLALHWSTLPEARRLFAADSKFEQFVLRHMDASANTADLERIAANSTKQCPPDAEALCQKIAGVANQGLTPSPVRQGDQ